MTTCSDTSQTKIIRELLTQNKIWSNKAHKLAKQNPLVTIAIYGASRKIYNRELKVQSGVNHLLKDEEDLKTRIERNKIILTAAKTESEKLLIIYKDTLDILKKYRDTKDESLLTEEVKETHDMNLREYIDKGNFAFPMSIYRKFNIPQEKYPDILEMRDKAIKDAEDIDDNTDDIEYNNLIEATRELGKDQKFDEAFDILEKAYELKPDKIEAIWGIATTAHHRADFEKSKKFYDILVEKEPDNGRFKFERAQVMLCIDPTDGLSELGKLMAETEEFDFFLLNLGRLYAHAGLYDKAIIAIENYIKKFPVNMEALSELEKLYIKNGMEDKAEKINRKIESMKVK